MRFTSMWRLHAIAFVLLVAGCAGPGGLRYESPEEAFTKGMEYFERGRYARAAQYFQAVFDFGRMHDWADDAQLALARTRRANQEFILAASEYARFTELYRADPRIPTVEYERAMTFYERSPEFELDQGNTERGIEVFYVFMQRYPEHDSVDAALARVQELRDKLAYKQFTNAGLYERRELYEAAALSFEVVFDKFPDTELADDALLGAMRCYMEYSNQSIAQRQPERLQKAIDHYQRLIQIFPDSDLIDEAEVLFNQARGTLDQLMTAG